MGDLFFRSLKAFIIFACIICGIGTFVAVEEGNIRPMMISVLSFGGAYWLSAIWRGLQAKGVVLTVALMVAGAFVAMQLPEPAYRLFQNPIFLNYYFIWALLMLFPGLPAMMLIFKKYSD